MMKYDDIFENDNDNEFLSLFSMFKGVSKCTFFDWKLQNTYYTKKNDHALYIVSTTWPAVSGIYMVSKTMHLYKGLVRPSKKNCLSEEKRLVRNFSSDSQFLFEGFSCLRMVNYLVRLSMPVEANDSLVGMRLFDTWHHPMRALWLPYIFHETKAVNRTSQNFTVAGELAFSEGLLPALWNSPIPVDCSTQNMSSISCDSIYFWFFSQTVIYSNLTSFVCNRSLETSFSVMNYWNEKWNLN